eukprot:scaffold143790_cov37-Tisochrysis_lutea.AAC.1
MKSIPTISSSVSRRSRSSRRTASGRDALQKGSPSCGGRQDAESAIGGLTGVPVAPSLTSMDSIVDCRSAPCRVDKKVLEDLWPRSRRALSLYRWPYVLSRHLYFLSPARLSLHVRRGDGPPLFFSLSSSSFSFSPLPLVYASVLRIITVSVRGMVDGGVR